MMMFEVETTTKPRMSRTDEAVAAVPFPDLDPDRRIPAGLPNLYVCVHYLVKIPVPPFPLSVTLV